MKSFSRFDAREAHARHAVHARWQKQSVPMNGSVFLKIIRDSQNRVGAFAQTHERTRNRSVDGDDGAPPFAERHLEFADHQVYLVGLGTSDWTRLLAGVFQSVSRHEAWQARQQAECGGGADEAPPVEWLEC